MTPLTSSDLHQNHQGVMTETWFLLNGRKQQQQVPTWTFVWKKLAPLTLEGLPGSLHELLHGVAGQLSSSVFGLAVGARIQTPGPTQNTESRYHHCCTGLEVLRSSTAMRRRVFRNIRFISAVRINWKQRKHQHERSEGFKWMKRDNAAPDPWGFSNCLTHGQQEGKL